MQVAEADNVSPTHTDFKADHSSPKNAAANFVHPGPGNNPNATLADEHSFAGNFRSPDHQNRSIPSNLKARNNHRSFHSSDEGYFTFQNIDRSRLEENDPTAFMKSGFRREGYQELDGENKLLTPREPDSSKVKKL